MSINPIVRKPYKPNPKKIAQFAREGEIYRQKIADQKTQERPILERIMLVSGVELNNLETALDCICGCHPKAPTFSLHDGGRTCSCQLTPEQLKKQRHSALKNLSRISQKIQPVYNANHEEFNKRVEELNIQAKIEVSGAPFVIVGNVDGRGFYLRERHGEYRVTIAPNSDPSSNPWDSQGEVIDIVSGSESEFSTDKNKLFSIKALEISVSSVRAYLRQIQCQHDSVNTRYCPNCGKELIPAYLE